MDEALIDNINVLVQQRDILYHLGDWSFGYNRQDKTNNAKHYLDQIKCENIILITGNHDPHYASGIAREEFASLFKECYDILQIKLPINGEQKTIVLFHYSMRVWNKSHHGAWSLFGHSHYSLPDDPHALSIDVGVDAVAGRSTGKTHQELRDENAWHLLNPLQYRPISLDEINTIMSSKKFKPIDHHAP